MPAFVDQAQLHAKAGNGGAGAVAFRREAHVDRGGPDGGDGGRGGDLWLVATTNQASLLAFRDHPHRRAGDGGHGGGKRRHGARGSDVDVPIPVGTVVRDADRTVLCDLGVAGSRWLVAEGGRGGAGNARFLSNRRRAPAFAEQGELGEERWLGLELKLVADVAIVGFPNVGKSTLIAAVSAARPKIADYPFTTLEPHLGVARVGGRPGRVGTGDEVELVIADVPGLVEGAAEGRGLGHQFLRHVERARVLLVLVDLADPGGMAPSAQLATVLGELGRYQPGLLDRPRVVVGSRLDLVAPGGRGARTTCGRGVARPSEVELEISAVTGDGVRALLGRLASLVVQARRAEAGTTGASASGPGAAPVVHRPLPQGLQVERVAPGTWALVGRAASRAVSFQDLTDEGAMDEALRRLRRLGVDRALAHAGAREGDVVAVGAVTFRWYRDGSEAAADAIAEADRSERPRRDR